MKCLVYRNQSLNICDDLRQRVIYRLLDSRSQSIEWLQPMELMETGWG